MRNPLRGRRLLPFLQTALVTYGGTALSILSAPLLARAVGADGRGVLAGAFVVLQLLAWVSFLGLPRGLALQGFKRTHVSVSGVVIVFVLGVISAIIAVLVADLVSNGDARIALGIRISAVLLIAAGISQLGVELVLVQGRLWAYNLIRSSVLVLPSIAYIVTFFLGALTLPVAFVITLAGQLLSVILGCIFAVSLMRKARKVPVPWDFSLKYWSASALDAVGGRADQLALSALTSSSVLGIYAVAVSCASASGGLTQALNTLVYSRLTQLSGRDNSVFLRQRSLLGVGFSLIAGTAIVLVVAFWGQAIFGPGFEGLAPIVVVLVAGQLIADQWALRVLADSAQETPTQLALASALGVGVLAITITALSLTGTLTGLTMACAMLVFALTRLTARAVISRSHNQGV